MKTHNKSNTKLYRVWNSMKQRCFNKNDKFYFCYGGRGITVCEEWINSFQSFYNWAINNGYQENLSIDRRNVNGNYSPENCRWVDMKTQQRNRRDRKKFLFNGKEKTLAEISEETGIAIGTLWERNKRGVQLDGNIDRNKERRKYANIKKLAKHWDKVILEAITICAKSNCCECPFVMVTKDDMFCHIGRLNEAIEKLKGTPNFIQNTNSERGDDE